MRTINLQAQLTKFFLHITIFFLALNLTLAQQQPPVAINSQDEQVNINKEVPSDTEKLTIFRSGDKSEINHYISQVVELKNAQAYEILPHVSKAVQLEKGNVRTLTYKDPQTGKERNFVQIITTPEQMDSIAKTIESIDLPGMTSSEGDVKYNYRLKYRRASEVAAIINATTRSGEGKVGFDNVTNSIYLQDSPSDSMRELITAQFYDVPPPQIEFEILAVEIEEDKSADLGLDWDAWKQNVGGQFEFTGNYFEGGEGFARLDALLTLDAVTLAKFLNYTAQTGSAKVLTRSTITASNNIPGIVSSLKRVVYPLYLTQEPKEVTKELMEETPGVTASGEEPCATSGKRPVYIMPPTRSVLTDVNAGTEGLFLSVEPTVGTDMVTAKILLIVNSVLGYSKLGQPIIAERRSDTTITLKDNEPFHVGGIDKESSADGRSGIPGLKEIPIVRYLFSVERNKVLKSKIYVVMTPHFKNQVILTSPLIKGTEFTAPPEIKGIKVNTETAVPKEE